MVRHYTYSKIRVTKTCYPYGTKFRGLQDLLQYIWSWRAIHTMIFVIKCDFFGLLGRIWIKAHFRLACSSVHLCKSLQNCSAVLLGSSINKNKEVFSTKNFEFERRFLGVWLRNQKKCENKKVLFFLIIWDWDKG